MGMVRVRGKGRVERGCREQQIVRALQSLGWEPARLIVAKRPDIRLLGMIAMSRSGFGTGMGEEQIVMAFPHCSAVHTCFMRHPLDIAFTTDAGEVVCVQYGVSPWRFLSCPGASVALERFSTQTVR